VPPPADPYFGRVAGNGRWFARRHCRSLDMRGWKLAIVDDGVAGAPLFTADPVWSDLRAGTIVTISEDVADDATTTRRTATGGSPCAPLMRPKLAPVAPSAPRISPCRVMIGSSRSRSRRWVVFGPAGKGVLDDHGVPIDVGVNEEMFSLQERLCIDRAVFGLLSGRHFLELRTTQ
jgi:hypothetical protein